MIKNQLNRQQHLTQEYRVLRGSLNCIFRYLNFACVIDAVTRRAQVSGGGHPLYLSTTFLFLPTLYINYQSSLF